MATPKIIADFETQLGAAISIADTSFTLSTAVDDDGVALPAGLYYFTLDNGTTQKEYLEGTLSGTAVTGVSNISRQGVVTVGALKAHRVGSSVVLTDFMTYKKYIDETSLAGAPDASVSTKGVVEAATLAQVRARTALGETGAALAITPDVLTDLPTVEEKNFLLASTGMISMYVGASAPTGFLLCDGTAVSRVTYASLFAVASTTYGAGDGSTTFNVPDLRSSFPVGQGQKTKAFTFVDANVTVGTDAIAVTANQYLYSGQAVVLSTTGTLPAGLSAGTYYIIYVSDTSVKLASSRANADDGTAVDITAAAGGGVHTLTLSLTNRTLGTDGGEESHTLQTEELASHSHRMPRDGVGGSGNGYDSSGDAIDPGAFTEVTGGDTPHNNMPPFVVVNYIIKT